MNTGGWGGGVSSYRHPTYSHKHTPKQEDSQTHMSVLGLDRLWSSGPDPAGPLVQTQLVLSCGLQETSWTDLDLGRF